MRQNHIGRLIAVLLAVIGLAGTGGCETDAQTGLLIGSAIGAAAGAGIDHDNRGRGAAIGAGIGAIGFWPAAELRVYGAFLTALFVLATGITVLRWVSIRSDCDRDSNENRSICCKEEDAIAIG